MDHARLPTIALTGKCSPDEAMDMASALLKARTRRTHPDTSRDAAQSVREMTDRRSAVLSCFEHFGEMTDEEFLDVYERKQTDESWPEQSVSGLRTRRSELVRFSRLADTGRRKRMRSNRQAIVWGLAEEPVTA